LVNRKLSFIDIPTYVRVTLRAIDYCWQLL